MNEPKDGPTLHEYIETRLTLLAEAMEKRFAGGLMEREAYRKVLDDRFAHVEQMFKIGQESAQRAVDKQEAAQAAHNVATNEWRSTVNDLTAKQISRPEFERWVTEFSNYRLAASSVASASQGERRGAKETKDATIAQVSAISAAVGVIVSVAASFIFRAPAIPAPAPQSPQVVVVPAAPVAVQPQPKGATP